MSNNVIIIDDTNTNSINNSSNNENETDKDSQDENNTQNVENTEFSCNEVCIVTTGNVDSGKSTLIGTLVTNELDDGNGKLRMLIAKHQHEIISGKTSDISIRTIQKYEGKEVVLVDLCGHKKYLGTTIFGLTGYFPDYGMLIVSAKGMQVMTQEHMRLLLCLNIPFSVIITREDIVPLRRYEKTISDIKNILKNKKKTVIVNTCNRKSLKEKACEIEAYITETYSHNMLKKDILIKSFQDYCEGDLSLNDRKVITDEHAHNLSDILDIFNKSYQDNYIPKITKLASNMKENPYLVPVVTISNKTGYCLDLVKELVYNLKSRKDHWDPNENTVFYIDSSFEKVGIGIIVSGVLRGREVSDGQIMYLGPYGTKFIKIKIWSIHNNKKETIKSLTNAHRGCFAIRVLEKKVEFKRRDIRKGMVVVSDISNLENLCYEFDADINILHHSTTIKTGFSPSLQLTNSKQAARIVILDKGSEKNEATENNQPTSQSKDIESLPDDQKQLYLRTGDKAKVKFRFLYKPEFVRNGDEFIFKEETTRGRGKVTGILSLSNDKKGAIEVKRNQSNRQFKSSIKKGTLSIK